MGCVASKADDPANQYEYVMPPKSPRRKRPARSGSARTPDRRHRSPNRAAGSPAMKVEPTSLSVAGSPDSQLIAAGDVTVDVSGPASQGVSSDGSLSFANVNVHASDAGQEGEGSYPPLDTPTGSSSASQPPPALLQQRPRTPQQAGSPAAGGAPQRQGRASGPSRMAAVTRAQDAAPAAASPRFGVAAPPAMPALGAITSRPVPAFSLNGVAASPARHMASMGTPQRAIGTPRGATGPSGTPMRGPGAGGPMGTPSRAIGTPGRSVGAGAAGTPGRAAQGTPSRPKATAMRPLFSEGGESVQVPGREGRAPPVVGFDEFADDEDELAGAAVEVPMFVAPALLAIPPGLLELGKMMYQKGDVDTEEVDAMELLARSGNVALLSRAVFGLKNERQGPMFSPGPESSAMAKRVCAVASYNRGVGHSKGDHCNAVALALVNELAMIPVKAPSPAAISVLRHCLHEFGAEERDILMVQTIAEQVEAGEASEEMFVQWLSDLQRVQVDARNNKVLPPEGRALMDTTRAVTNAEVGPIFNNRYAMLRAIAQAALCRPLTV